VREIKEISDSSGREGTKPRSRVGRGLAKAGHRKGNPRQLGIHDSGVVLRNLDYKRSNGADRLTII
jgi:hypothetical protein